jgi:hypothetical protein
MSRLQTLTLTLVVGLAAAAGFLACHRGPTNPGAGSLAIGLWTGNGACLAVAASNCNLVVGCGHGQFPPPSLRADGTFDVDGTYRIEVGPIASDPAPPAHFSGSLSGSRLILTVTPTVNSLPRTSLVLTLTGTGSCPVPCV